MTEGSPPDRSGHSRAQQLAALGEGEFDVLVIGGGITGAGIAWDCALRGLSVALLERTDFGAGTSGVSSKMVHAGLRYMVGDAELVREASAERQWMFRAGAHLARPVEYYLPAYRDSPEYGADCLADVIARYDELAGGSLTAASRLVAPEEALAQVPGLRRDPLRVGSYWDGVMDDARFNLEVILSATQSGAVALNHACVTEFLRDQHGRLQGVRFRDEAPGAAGASHTVRAAAIVSAAGVYTDLLLSLPGAAVRGAAGAQGRRAVLRPSKGMHLLFRSRLPGGRALVVPMGDNILTFLVPFLDEYLIMGTTDTDYPVRRYRDLDRVPVTPEDVRYTLDSVGRVLPGVFGPGDVIAAYSGVRPLVRQEPAPGTTISESATSRTHKIWRTEAGLWVIAGGKYTTFRLMAEQLADRVVEELHRVGRRVGKRPCSTRDRRIHGAPPTASGPGEAEAWLRQASAALDAGSALAEDSRRQLCRSYGEAAGEVAELARSRPELAARIGQGRPWVLAEIPYAVSREMCLTLSDFMVRRTGLRFTEHQGLDVAPRVAEALGAELGWSPAECRRQLREYRDWVLGVWSPR